MIRKHLLTTFTLVAACAVLALAASADDKKADPTGTWTWSTPGRNGGPDRTNTLTLKVDGAKLTGKLSAPGRQGRTNETDIADGKLDADTVSFNVVREANGNSITNAYTGKVSADAITGKIEFSRNGEPTTRDWKATRSTDVPAATAAKPADAKPADSK